MKIGIAIQARMGSKRFPGKVLSEAAGRPLMHYLIDNLRRCRSVVQLVVATSVEPSDDDVAKFCRRYDLACWRGSEEDVAGRFVDVVRRWSWDAVVRISGDSPLLDYRLVDHGVRTLRKGRLDLVTNVFPRSFPQGQSVEVITSEALIQSRLQMTTAHHCEHVTPWFYENSALYRIENFSSPQPLQGCKLTVDTPEDLQRINQLILRLERPHWSYRVDELAGIATSLWSGQKPWQASGAAA